VGLGGSRLPNNKKSATSYGAGGGSAAPIPLGMPFAGRSAGGGNRQGVYGNKYAMPRHALLGPELTCVHSIYGSGYPGVLVPRGVAGLGFPFFFWPVVWSGSESGNGSSAYLYDAAEVRQEVILTHYL